LSTPTDASTTPVSDTARENLLATLRTVLGDRLLAEHLVPGDDLWIRVAGQSWRDTARLLRDNCGLQYFCFLSAIDWMPSPFGRGEDDPTEPAPERDTTVRQGVTGGATRFQLLVRLVHPVSFVGVTIKVDVPDDSLTLDSVCDVFGGANWHERETNEMFGIAFAGHPDMRKMYLPIDFEGHPLRKDFPLLARMIKPWPGIVDVEPLPEGFGSDGEES